MQLKAFVTALLKELCLEHDIKEIGAHAYFESFSGAQMVALFEGMMHYPDAGACEFVEAIWQALAADAAVGLGVPVPHLDAEVQVVGEGVKG